MTNELRCLNIGALLVKFGDGFLPLRLLNDFRKTDKRIEIYKTVFSF